MSLHCPATIVVVSGADDDSMLADRLRERRVAAVYTGERPEAAATGRRLAAELGVAASTTTGLDDVAARPARLDESLPELERLRPLADLHRGETVVVLLSGRPDEGPSSVELEIGDEGVRVLGR